MSQSLLCYSLYCLIKSERAFGMGLQRGSESRSSGPNSSQMLHFLDISVISKVSIQGEQAFGMGLPKTNQVG